MSDQQPPPKAPAGPPPSRPPGPPPPRPSMSPVARVPPAPASTDGDDAEDSNPWGTAAGDEGDGEQERVETESPPPPRPTSPAPPIPVSSEPVPSAAPAPPAREPKGPTKPTTAKPSKRLPPPVPSAPVHAPAQGDLEMSSMDDAADGGGPSMEAVDLESERESTASMGGGTSKKGVKFSATGNRDSTRAARPAGSGGKNSRKSAFYGRSDELAAEKMEKGNMPTPQGLTSAAKVNTELPSEMLRRLLLKGETVTGQFDYYRVNGHFSLRTRILLALCTLGGYLVYLFFKWLSTALRHAMCGSCQQCDDKIYSDRGKIVVTSMGRLICWEQELRQANGIDNKTHHDIAHRTRIFNVEDIAQTTVVYADYKYCCRCCCKDYRLALDVAFHGFWHYGDTVHARKSRYLYTNHASNFILNMKANIFGSVVYSTYNMLLYGERDSCVLRLTSTPRDYVYFDNEFGIEAVEDVCKLHAQICQLACNSNEENSSIRANQLRTPNLSDEACAQMEGYSKKNAQFGRNKNVFLSARASVDVEGMEQSYGKVDAVSLVGVREVSSDISNIQLVDDEGNVTVPVKWMPLCEGEEIISAVGQFYTPTLMDYMLSACTLGMYYAISLRSKLADRSAIILTTHRIVEVLLVKARAPRGRIPTELENINLVVRAYYPKKVLSGFIRSNGVFVESAIVCAHGQLVVRLPAAQLAFAQKMQLCTSREEPLDVEGLEMMLPEELGEMQQGPGSGYTGAFTANSSAEDHHEQDRANAAGIGSSSGVAAAAASMEDNPLYSTERETIVKEATHKLTSLETVLLPLMPTESLVHRFRGGKFYLPCCALPSLSSLCGSLLCPSSPSPIGAGKHGTESTYKRLSSSPSDLLQCLPNFFCSGTIHPPGAQSSNYLCTFTGRGGSPNSFKCCSFVTVARMFSCCTRPILSAPKCIITDQSMYYITTTTSAKTSDSSDQVLLSKTPCCGPAQYYIEPFMISWVPIRSLKDQEMSIYTQGAKPFGLFLCCANPPISRDARYHLMINTREGFRYPFSEKVHFKSWLKDQRLSSMQGVLGALQSQISAEHCSNE